MDHHQQPPQQHHHHQEQQQVPIQYQRRNKRSPVKQEEKPLDFQKIEKRFKSDDHHQDLLVKLEDVFLSDYRNQQEQQQFTSLIQQQDHENSLFLKIEQGFKNDDQDLLVSNLEDVFLCDNNQEQQFTSLIEQQHHEDSLTEVIKELQDQITTVVPEITNQDNQFSSSPLTTPLVPRFVSESVSEPLDSFHRESCGSLFSHQSVSHESSTVMAREDLVGFDALHLARYILNDEQLYQLLQYSKILSLNFAFDEQYFSVDRNKKIRNDQVNTGVSDYLIGHPVNVCVDNNNNDQYFSVDDKKIGINQNISVSDYLVGRPVDVCVGKNGGGFGNGGGGGSEDQTDDEWIERVLNEVSLASESHQILTEVQYQQQYS